MIVEGIDPRDVAELAAKRGYPDLVFHSEDLGGFTEIDEHGRAIGVGGVGLHADGKLWLGLIGPCRPIFHRRALRLLEALAKEGVKEIWTYPDSQVPGAEKWIRRLGFKKISSEEWFLCLKLL